MTTQEIRNIITKNTEILKDTDIIEVTDMRDAIYELNLSIYVGLQEYEVYGIWNELRQGNIVLDMDAPDNLTLDRWVVYLYKHCNHKEEEPSF